MDQVVKKRPRFFMPGGRPRPLTVPWDHCIYSSMTRDQTIILRVDAETKARIEQAARLRGLSITSFMLETAMKTAQRIEKRPPPAPSGACPGFFKALCREASLGGANTYTTPGYELSRHMASLVDDLEGLYELFEERPVVNDDSVLDWLSQALPRCMALVPQRRRDSFLEGFYQYDEDYGIEWGD